jgi:UDP-glucuronate 4-epimerase
MERDFTYIADIVEAVVRLLPHIPQANPAWRETDGDLSASFAPYKVYNIGNSHPEKLGYFIEVLEQALGRRAAIEYLPMQPGDVPSTCAAVSDLIRDIGFRPATSIEEGLNAFVSWYREYYSVV